MKSLDIAPSGSTWRSHWARIPRALGGFVTAQLTSPFRYCEDDSTMFTAIDPPETRTMKPAGAEFWHLCTVIIPRLSITGHLVHGRV